MTLSDQEKAELKKLVKQYSAFEKALFPLPSEVLKVSSRIINLLALAAGVSVESE